MDTSTGSVLGAVLGSVVGGGALMTFTAKILERRWGKADKLADGHATVEIRQIDSHDSVIKGLQEQINGLQSRLDAKELNWQKRFDEQQANLLDRMDKQRLEFQKRDDEQQRQLDEWKSRFFEQQEKLVTVQGHLIALRAEYDALQKRVDSPAKTA